MLTLPPWRRYPPQDYAAQVSPRLVVSFRPPRSPPLRSLDWHKRARRDRSRLRERVLVLFKNFKDAKLKKKKNKFPEHPKRAANAYALFFKEKQQELRKQQPLLEQQEVTREVARKWKELTHSEKLKYKEQEDSERAISHVEKHLYIANQISLGKRYKIVRPVDFPRRAKTAYLFYVQERKAQAQAQEETKEEESRAPPQKQRALLKMLGKQWHELSREAKEPYLKRARADKARFRMEYEGGKTQHVGAQPEEAEPHLEAHTISKTKNNNND